MTKDKLQKTWWTVGDGVTTEVYSPEGDFWIIPRSPGQDPLVVCSEGLPVKSKFADRLVRFADGGGPTPR